MKSDQEDERQTPAFSAPAYHPPQKYYKNIYQGLILPNLPAPLHYFSFISLLGQPNIPILRNQSGILNNDPMNTATTLSSISAHMAGYFHSYLIDQHCQLSNNQYRFAEREYLIGSFPHFEFVREDQELSVRLSIKTSPMVNYFAKMTLSFLEYWSMPCHFSGEIRYQGQMYLIDQVGTFEYARTIPLPYLPLYFFTYQVIALDANQILLLSQIRNNLNKVVQSQLCLTNLNTLQSTKFDHHVKFNVLRVYPAITTPNHQTMYLPREFIWQYQDNENQIQVKANSRGDFKFGAGAGYVGSFHYEVNINGTIYVGEQGYCEYIDCRPLKWQEIDKQEKFLTSVTDFVPILLKK